MVSEPQTLFEHQTSLRFHIFCTGLLKAWIYREILLSLGVVDATRESIKYVLTQKGAGHSIVLVVGGAAEISHCRPDSYVLQFSRRKGFIKLALETG